MRSQKMKKGDNVIIIAKIGSNKRLNAFKFNLKEKVKITKLKDEGYIVKKGKNQSFVIDAEIAPETCNLTGDELQLIFETLFYDPREEKKEERNKLACKLQKTYHSGIKSIEINPATDPDLTCPAYPTPQSPPPS